MRTLLLPAIGAHDGYSEQSIVRSGLFVIALALLGVCTWSALAPLSGAVIAPGVVKVDTNRKTVQHQEGGIVKQILVRDGDRVAAGQTLIVLDDVRVDAAHDLLQMQLDAEIARVARLSAERTFAGDIAFPAELLARRSDPRIAGLMRNELALFATRRQALENQIRLLQSQAGETRAEIAARQEQEKADASSIDLQQEEIDANESLVNQGFVSKTKLLSLRRARADYEARRGENRAGLAQAREKVSELELRAVTLRSLFMQQAADELKEANLRVYDLRERVRPTEDAARRQNIVAPVDGVVVDLKVGSPGAVIAPREALMDIVPTGLDLIVEAHVKPEDINNVTAGASADLRLTAFKRRVTPVVGGTVTYVSADRFTERGPNPAGFYVARVRVTPEALKQAGDLKLQAGMPAEVYVRTGERTVLEYLSDPVLGYLRRGMREP